MARGKSKTAALLKTSPQRITPYENLFWEYSSPGSMRAIIRAALECFSERGFHGTSTRDVAKRANMSPAAIYVHFKSKEELLFHLAVVMTRAGYSGLVEAAAAPGTFSEKLNRLVSSHTAFHAKMSLAAKVTNFEIAALQPRHRSIVIDIYNKSEDIFRSCLREGQQAGEFYFSNLSIITAAVMSMILAVCRWYIPGGAQSPEQVGDLYAKMVLAMATSDVDTEEVKY